MGHGNVNMVGGNWKSLFFFLFLDTRYVHCMYNIVYEERWNITPPYDAADTEFKHLHHTYTQKVPVYIYLLLYQNTLALSYILPSSRKINQTNPHMYLRPIRPLLCCESDIA